MLNAEALESCPENTKWKHVSCKAMRPYVTHIDFIKFHAIYHVRTASSEVEIL